MAPIKVGQVSRFFQSPEWRDLASRPQGVKTPAFSSLELSRKVELSLLPANERVPQRSKAEVRLSFDPVSPNSVQVTFPVGKGVGSGTVPRSFFDQIPPEKGLFNREVVTVPVETAEGSVELTFRGTDDLRKLSKAMEESLPRKDLATFHHRTSFDELAPGQSALPAVPTTSIRERAPDAPPIKASMQMQVDGQPGLALFESGTHPDELIFQGGVDGPRWHLSARQFVEAADFHRVMRSSQPDAAPAKTVSHAPSEADAAFWADGHDINLTLRPADGTPPVLIRFDGMVAAQVADRFRDRLAQAQLTEDAFLPLDGAQLRSYLFDVAARARQTPAERAVVDGEMDQLLRDLGSPPEVMSEVKALRARYPAEPEVTTGSVVPSAELGPSDEKVVQEFNDGLEDWLKGL